MKKRLFFGFLSAMIIIGFAGCNSRNETAADMSMSSYTSSHSPEASMSYESYNSPAESDSIMSSMVEGANISDEMVYRVTLELQTTDFDTGNRALIAGVRELGGYIETAYVSGRSLYRPDADRSADYTFRIPSGGLTEFLEMAEADYNLCWMEQQAVDTTVQGVRASGRLDDLRTQEERLLAGIAVTTDGEERLLLEEKLSEVQREINDLTASEDMREKAVSYSTVYVSLREVDISDIVDPEPETFGARIQRTARDSFDGFVAFCEGAVLFIIMMLPVLLVLMVFALIGFILYRFWCHRGRAFVAKITGRGQSAISADYKSNENGSGE